jgi:hypothetical protein
MGDQPGHSESRVLEEEGSQPSASHDVIATTSPDPQVPPQNALRAIKSHVHWGAESGWGAQGL